MIRQTLNPSKHILNEIFLKLINGSFLIQGSQTDKRSANVICPALNDLQNELTSKTNVISLFHTKMCALDTYYDGLSVTRTT